MNELLPVALPEGPQAEPTIEEKAHLINHQGTVLFSKGHMEPAKAHFLAALTLVPDHAQALQNLGAVLRNQGHMLAAASVARRSVRASGNNVYCRSNLGVSLLGLRQYRESLEVLGSVIADMPNNGFSWHNYGLTLYMCGQYEAALEAFETARGLANLGPQVDSDRALTLLSMGLIAEGLKAYEVRWEILTKSRIWGLGIMEWLGEPPAGKRILVHHEQGFGDSLMLSRFIPALVAEGAIVTMAVPEELVRLFENSFGAIATVVNWNEEKLGVEWTFDYHTPMLSLMRHLGVGAPHHLLHFPAKYLAAPNVDDIVERLPPADIRIGICWASGNHGPQLAERRRLANLTDFLPLTEIPGASVISLQKGHEVNDLDAFGMRGLVFDLAPRFTDFAATAAVIAKLDFVISVDSAVAHLAGALGVPTIMLSPFSRCWRWWTQGDAKPWYTDMKILYQAENGTWTEAVRSAIGEIMDRLKISADM